MASVAIAVDLGGTNVRCSVVSRDGEMRFESSQSSGGDEGPDPVIRRITRMIGVAVEDQELPGDVAIGIVAPGPLDPKTGIVRYAPNLRGWDEVPLQARLEEETGRRVLLGNDGNAQALGEFFFGAARDVDNLVYVALGTGLGGGVIAERQLIDGAHGLGAEIGHTTIAVDGPRCTCGSRGCIEAICSGWAIARDGRLLVDTGRSEAIREAAAGGEIDARVVSDAAEDGDEGARTIIERAGWSLGAALGNFVNIFNPEMIVVGGGLARIGDMLLDPAKRALREYAMVDMLDDLEFRTSALGGKTGIYGAAAMVFHEGEF